MPNSYVQNMNGPKPPPARARIRVRRPCWDISRKAGYGQVTFPSFIENTGNLTANGQWFYNVSSNRFLVRTPQNLGRAEVSVPRVFVAS